jgi:class 3 adenylate cyclase
VSGIHSTGGTHHAGEIASMALDIVSELSEMRVIHNGKPVAVRIGVHTGPVATGIIGYQTLHPCYSVFGSAVRRAALMESTGSEMKIQISESTYKELMTIGGYIAEERKDIDSSGLKTYWLVGRTEEAVQRRPINPSWLCKYQSNISLTNRDPFIDPISNDDV